MTDQPFVDWIVQRYLQRLIDIGVPENDAKADAAEFEHEIRSTKGAEWHYLHGPDLRKRNRVILNAWNASVRRNAALPSRKRQTIPNLRDQVCNDHGISRSTFYDILNGRVAEQNKP